MMGKIVKQAAEVTADRNCIGAAKLVVFCNAQIGRASCRERV